MAPWRPSRPPRLRPLLVTSGHIPPDVANSQTAMLQVQQRLNQISQMNQMMTQMMQTAHQMQMAIIQNFRV